MRRILVALAAVALAAIVVIGLTNAGGGDKATRARPFDLAQARTRLAVAPAPLAGLYRQANELLGGGRSAFRRRLAALRGHSVIVNKWASWCGPCRAEFPVFQRVAAQRGTRVAFLGVNGTDKRAAARAYLREYPLPYPSYEDPHEDIARSIRAPQNYPMTVFVDARGRTAFIHAGPYTSDAALNRDIEHYLGHA